MKRNKHPPYGGRAITPELLILRHQWHALHDSQRHQNTVGTIRVHSDQTPQRGHV